MSTNPYNYDYESAYPAITEVVSREFDNIVLLYSASDDSQVTALAFQINRTARRIERITNGPTLDADGGADDTIDFGYFGENGHSEDVTGDPGDEVFQVDAERNETLIEYGFGVLPDGVLTAIRTADDAPVFGLRAGSNKARGFGVSDLAQFGGVDSEVTRTAITDELPTTALSPTPRQGLFRVDSKQDGLNRFRFAFDNTTGAQQTVELTAVGQTYDVNIVENKEDVLDMVSPGGTPARLVTWGGFDNQTPNLPREWYNNRATISVDNIALSA